MGYCASVKRALLVLSTLLAAGCGDSKRGGSDTGAKDQGPAKASPAQQLSRIALPELDNAFSPIDAAAISLYATKDGVGMVSQPGEQPRAIEAATTSVDTGVDRPLFDALLETLASSTLTASEQGDRMVLSSSPLALFADATLPAAAVGRLAWTARAAGVVGEILLVAQRGGGRTGVPIRAPNPAGAAAPTIVVTVTPTGASVDVGGTQGSNVPAAKARALLSTALEGQDSAPVGLRLHDEATHRDLMLWASMAVDVGAQRVVLAVDGSFEPEVPNDIQAEVERTVAAANKAVCEEQLPTLLDMHESDPKNESLYDAIARTYGGICSDPVEESAWIRKRTEVFPQSPDAWHALALRRLRAVLPQPGETTNDAVPAAQRATRCDEVIGYLETALEADPDHRPALQLTVIAHHQRQLTRSYQDPPKTPKDEQDRARAIVDGHAAWAATKRLCTLDGIADCDPEQAPDGTCCPPPPFETKTLDDARALLESR